MNIEEKTIIKHFDIIVKELDDVSFFSANNILIDNDHLKVDSQSEKEYLFELSDKIKTFGISRGYFLENGDNGWLKLTEKGIDLKESKKGHLKFKKSSKSKIDYLKWFGVVIAGLSLAWNMYQGTINNQLKDDNRILGDKVEALEKENAGLIQNMTNLTQQRYDEAEIQVIDLLHLVETKNKQVFAELVTYFGTDKKRHLKTHIDLKSESEKETNELYFRALQNIINECNKLKPRTGNIDTDFSFVITHSKKENIGDLEIVRVNMNYCLPDEVECIDKTFYFDFVMGEKDYLLIDINKAELYKN